jgi:MFS family permease
MQIDTAAPPKSGTLLQDGLRKAPLVTGATIVTMLGTTPTLGAIFGLFLIPITQEFSWSRTQVAGAFTAMSLSAMLFYPIAGRLVDRFGTRRVLLIGLLFQAAFTLALSQLSPNPWTYYALFAFAGAAGAVTSNMVISKMLSQSFDRGRGFWMGFVSGVGNGAGAVSMPIIAASLLTEHGWRGTFIIVGLLVLLLGVPVAWLTMKPAQNASAPAKADAVTAPAPGDVTLGEAMRRPLFWIIFSAVPVGGGALTAVFSNVAPILAQRGISLEQTTTIIATFAAICVLWEPLVGFFLDRTDRPRCVAPFYFFAVAGLLILAKGESFQILLLGGALTGIGLGSEFSVLPYLLSRYFGLSAMGAISGVAFAGVLGASAVTPILLNGIFDLYGTYEPGLYIVAAGILYAGIVFLFLGRYPVHTAAP